MSKHEQDRYSRQEIISVLSELQIANISDGDLIHPNSALICNVYKAILQHIDGFQEDNGEVEFEDLERLGNPEQHVDSVPYVKLCNSIKHFLAALRCPNKYPFSLRDLITPDPDRTEHFLSILLNFCIYRETKMEDLRTIVEETDLLTDQKLELEDGKAQLLAAIEEMNQSTEREMPLVQEISTKVNQLRQTIQGLNNHQMSIKATMRKLKEKAQEIDKEITNAEFTLVQSLQENANLRSKIVQSPDKLQRTLEEKKLVQAEAKNAERAARQSFQEKSAVFEVYTKACTKMSKHLTQMQALQDQVNSAKSVEKELKILKSKLSDEAMIVKSLESKLVEMQGKGDQLEELKKQLEKEREVNCSEALKELNNVKSEVESRRRDLVIRKRQVDAVLTEANSIMMKINSVRDSGAAKQQELSLKCEEVLQQCYNYSSDICQLLPITEDS
ncbi:hypothetical protein Leryth_007225 [Lithospermum erythrorhizon]|nr:hypothetical protein Leryth_007225 [Lithospermum erythrorhizon]